MKEQHVTEALDLEALEAKFKLWLETEGKKDLSDAMARAQATSEEFARVTTVRVDTLYEPVAF